MGKILEKLLTYPQRAKQVILITFDAILLSFCFLSAMWLRLDRLYFVVDPNIWIAVGIAISTSIVVFIYFGIYRSVLRYLSADILKGLGVGLLFSATVVFIITQAYPLSIPRSVPGIYFAISFISISGGRYLMHKLLSAAHNEQLTPVVIYGAGAAGRQLLNALKKGCEYRPIFFIDDDELFDGRVVNGLGVYNFKNGAQNIEKEQIETVLLAMPSISVTARKAVLDKLSSLNIEIKTMPGMTDIIEGRTEISQLRSIKIEELLERATVLPNTDLMDATIKGKNVLVTGAGGSIGSELCRQILNHKPNALILFDHSEHNLYQIEREIRQRFANELNLPKISAKLGSVQNSGSVLELFKAQKIDTVYHAAAYKHVPLIEENCIEAIKNNVLGTQILATASMKALVKNFILVSSDKAVRPANIMGATKRLAELICQSAANSQPDTLFSIVRFGNVMGSSGSVIPLFTEQIKNGGPITVTHKEITRFFMTITEAAQLVIQAASLSNGGEVFLLDMGKPIKILEVAQRMASLQGMRSSIEGDKDDCCDIKIVITGLRPGEKLFEELLISDDAQPTLHTRIMMANEEMVSSKLVKELISEFEQACAENDAQRAFSLLVSAPTGYNPKNAGIQAKS